MSAGPPDAEARPPSFSLGLLGAGIEGSLSPSLQERAGNDAGLNLTYRRIDAAAGGFDAGDLPEVLRWARRFGLDGFNVTHPFKQSIVPLLDELTTDARDLGAVNTVVFGEGRTLGANTDWSGYGRAFRRVLPHAVGDRVVLIGAGGAGVAVAYALLAQGAEHVALVERDRAKADDAVIRLAKVFDADRVSTATDLDGALADAGGLVNATPDGMLGHERLPLPAELVRPDLWVSDIVYFPLETQLLTLARSRGCRVVPGGGMAVFQAIGAFEHFTGRTPDAGRMLEHFQELTAHR